MTYQPPHLNHRASQYLERHQTRLAAGLAEHLFSVYRPLRTRYGTYGLERAQKKLQIHLDTLRNTLALETPAVFASDLVWFEAELNDRLGELDFISVLNEVRGYLAQQIPVVEARVVDRFITDSLRYHDDVDRPSTHLDADNPFEEIASRLLKMLLNEQRGAASALMFAAVKAEIGLKELYTHVLQPVQYEVGRLWATGEITVAREHYCTAAILSIMSELYPFCAPSTAAENDRTLVVATLGEELHAVGTRMLTDLLEMDGWQVGLLTSGVTTSRVEEALQQWEPDILALSVTMSSQLLETREIITALSTSSTTRDIKVIVGGRPFNIDDELWRKIGADGTAPNATKTTRLARRLYETERTDATEGAMQSRSPGTIWWHRRQTSRWQVVRDELGLTTGTVEGPTTLQTTFGLLTDQGGPKKLTVRIDEADSSQNRTVHLDIVKRGDTAVVVATTDPSDLEGLVAEGRETLEALEEVLEMSYFGDDASPPQESRPWESAGLYSELTELHRELALKNSRLEAVQQDRDALQAMLAHDIRNALTLIDTNSQFLDEVLAEYDIPDQAFEHLRTIRSKSSLIVELTEDLQELVRLENATIDKTPIQLESIVAQGGQDARTLGAKKEVDVEFVDHGEEPEIRADTKLLRRLLDNLLSNAVKFSPPHTEVQVQLTSGDGDACITVRDEGPGIPQEESEQLYEPFFTGSAEPTSGEKSTGLGLPIVKRIVDAHDGTLDIDSEVGEGTTFAVCLPAEP